MTLLDQTVLEGRKVRERKVRERKVRLDKTSLQVRNLKSFGNEYQGFDSIHAVNLIIGRNNTGKSTLLDLVDYATSPRNINKLGHRGQQPSVSISTELTETDLRKVFNQHLTSPGVPTNDWVYGRRWLGERITFELNSSNTSGRGAGNNHTFIEVTRPFEDTHLEAMFAHNLAEAAPNPFFDYSFKKLQADRDIEPEEDQDSPDVLPNGDGLTNTIQHFLNKATLTTSLVTNTLLEELNRVFSPDSHFIGIDVQQLEDGHWEIHLEEEEKGSIPLSRTGSGLKTILLVLSLLYLVPNLEHKPLASYMFGFEELENNLHPALQRRLLLYLRRVALDHGCRFFLTTHSNVTIDLFANDSEAQIVHVTHDGQQARARTVTTYVENRGILDDLDVRASDLLQSNGIVWVEGPTDRLYFNRWIELFSEDELQEGAHYQCVFYGGRLLSHLSAKDAAVDEDEAVKILRVNRNALVLIDSDKRHPSSNINATKRRIRSEIERFGDMAWVTKGKEVENYIPANALESMYSKANLVQVGQYDDFAEYLDSIKSGEGKRYGNNKMLFAEGVLPHLTKESLMNVLDLGDRVEEACNRIREWNDQKASV